MTPVARRIVRCPPTADALFPTDMLARNQRLYTVRQYAQLVPVRDALAHRQPVE